MQVGRCCSLIQETVQSYLKSHKNIVTTSCEGFSLWKGLRFLVDLFWCHRQESSETYSETWIYIYLPETDPNYRVESLLTMIRFVVFIS